MAMLSASPIHTKTLRGLVSIEVAQNNRKWNFPGDAVLKINIDARAGDDHVTNTTPIGSHIDGGPGNDQFIAGSGNDTIEAAARTTSIRVTVPFTTLSPEDPGTTPRS